MKTTTLNRSVLAALMGSVLAFGWGAPIVASAQDAAGDNVDGQQVVRSSTVADEQTPRNARRGRQSGNDADAAPSDAASADAARGQAQAQLRQRENDQRQADQMRERDRDAQLRQDAQAARESQIQQRQADAQRRRDDGRRSADQERVRQDDANSDQARYRPIVQDQVRVDRVDAPSYAEQLPRPAADGGRVQRPNDYQAVDAWRDSAGNRADGYGRSRGNDRVDAPRERSRDERIEEQRRQAEAYARQRDSRRNDAERWSRNLQSQHRTSGYRYQQDYWSRLSRQRYDWRDYDYYNDPYFSTGPSYVYYRGDNRYYINNYAADLLRQAINYGYREGIRAGQADRYDGWRFNYRDAYAYEDASFGYRGMYVSYSEYSYYFREGFRRGYEDGYYDNRRYGRYYNGSDNVLQTVLSLILDLRPYR